ncbi:MAG: hypothetical protein IPH37_10700 [Burkholderiales bacterium]|nr:hypothetical protein [Burkholderiales bacterium]
MTIPVFYRPEQSSSDAASYSPSADKPRQVVADWTAHEDIAPHINIESFEPASREILYAAHDKAYVDGVLDGTAENGFGNNNKGIAASLLYTTGSMLAAAKSALTARGNKVAVSPTSGFHHAHYSYGGGYCTFNGLIATAIEVHRLGLAKRILILDFDQHYGDGTQAIIDRLGLDYITHITACKSYETARKRRLPSPVNSASPKSACTT